MNRYNIIFLVLGCEENPFKNIEDLGLRSTWCSNIPENNKLFFCYGSNNSLLSIEGDKIFTPIKEDFDNILLKTISSFEYIDNNFDYDYIYRTNISSYIDTELLNIYIKDKPINGFYNGVIGNHNNIRFCSGSGYFLSRDLVKTVINSKEEFDYTLIDDVSLGKLLLNKGIHPILGERFDIINDNHPIPINYYHYRVKDQLNRNNDIIRLNKIFKIKHGKNLQ